MKTNLSRKFSAAIDRVNFYKTFLMGKGNSNPRVFFVTGENRDVLDQYVERVTNEDGISRIRVDGQDAGKAKIVEDAIRLFLKNGDETTVLLLMNLDLVDLDDSETLRDSVKELLDGDGIVFVTASSSEIENRLTELSPQMQSKTICLEPSFELANTFRATDFVLGVTEGSSACVDWKFGHDKVNENCPFTSVRRLLNTSGRVNVIAKIYAINAVASAKKGSAVIWMFAIKDKTGLINCCMLINEEDVASIGKYYNKEVVFQGIARHWLVTEEFEVSGIGVIEE